MLVDPPVTWVSIKEYMEIDENGGLGFHHEFYRRIDGWIIIKRDWLISQHSCNNSN